VASTRTSSIPWIAFAGDMQGQKRDRKLLRQVRERDVANDPDMTPSSGGPCPKDHRAL
jgi:hypothetical protein